MEAKRDSFDALLSANEGLRKALHAIGIATPEQLIARAQTPEGRSQLLAVPGMTEDRLSQLLTVARAGGAEKVGVYAPESQAADKVGVYGTAPETANAREVGVYGAAPAAEPAAETVGVYGVKPAPAPAPAPTPQLAPTSTTTVVEERRGFPWWLWLLLGLLLLGLLWWLLSGRQATAPAVPATVAPAATATAIPTIEAAAVAPTAPPTVAATVAPTAAPTVAPTVDSANTLGGAVAPQIDPIGSTVIVAGQSAVIRGTGNPGDEIEILDGDAVVGTTTVGADGAWSFEYTPSEAGDRTVGVRVAGSDTVTTSSIAVEAAEGVAPTIDPLTTVLFTVGQPVTIQGTGTPGEQLEILDGETVVGTVTVADDGTWSFEYTPTEAGDRNISVRPIGGDPVTTTVAVQALPTDTITGRVIDIDPASIPAGATLTMQLVDFSTQPAPVIGEQQVALDGLTAPYEFAIPYDAAVIDPTLPYNIQGNITDANGTLIWSTSVPFLVLTDEQPSDDVDVTMVRL
jgi:uncharacterized lipoprotein YbaY